MDEFALIGEVVRTLGTRAQGEWVRLGPGDDAAVIRQRPEHDAVASIDTLVADVHFPASAPGHLVGFRALMVSLSDLAAMAATPLYTLVAVTLPEDDVNWCIALAQGMREAAELTNTYICGGNFARGPLSITVSVHGEIPANTALTRAGAQVGDDIYISGALGGAAACTRLQEFRVAGELTPLQQCYYKPMARFDLQTILKAQASAAIDVSDGLSADLLHLCDASGVQGVLERAAIPVVGGAELADALYGGDDYQLIATSPTALPGMIRIGAIAAGQGVLLDGQQLGATGYNHFGP